jgi:hypothetical protein
VHVVTLDVTDTDAIAALPAALPEEFSEGQLVYRLLELLPPSPLFLSCPHAK